MLVLAELFRNSLVKYSQQTDGHAKNQGELICSMRSYIITGEKFILYRNTRNIAQVWGGSDQRQIDSGLPLPSSDYNFQKMKKT